MNKIANGAGLAVALLCTTGLFFGFSSISCIDELVSDKITRTQLKKDTTLEIKGLLGNDYYTNFPSGSERTLYAFGCNSDGKYEKIREVITSCHPHNQKYEKTFTIKDKEFAELLSILNDRRRVYDGNIVEKKGEEK